MDGDGGNGGDQSPDFIGRQKPQDAILECLQGMQSIFLFGRILHGILHGIKIFFMRKCWVLF